MGHHGWFCNQFLHISLFSTVLWDLANSRPVRSLMLSSNLFLCLPCLLPSFTVPCKMVLARPDEQETWPHHCSLHLFMMVRRSLCGLIACWILARTSLLVTWFLYEMCSILWQQPISIACILLWSSAVRVHDSQAYRKMDATREHISRIYLSVPSYNWYECTIHKCKVKQQGPGGHRVGWNHQSSNCSAWLRWT